MFLAATNGVVIATEKKMPSVLIDEKQMQKIEVINPSTGARAVAAAMPVNLQSTDDSR
jgi:20S proteasome alpha/beta subunit